jgi:FkbM family methyltransferase
MLKTVRRFCSFFPSFYSFASLLKLVWYKYGFPDYGSLRAALSCPEDSLLVDVGANRGQSAIMLSRLRPKCRIISFEPNPKCKIGLSVARLLVSSDRYSYCECGLSDQETDQTYYEPMVNNLPVSAEGTFCPENLDAKLSNRIGEFEVTTRTLPLRRLDSFDLSPSFIKIDVQGNELAVLIGAKETILRSKPIVVVERNHHNQEAVHKFLSAINYKLTSRTDSDDLIFSPQSQTH